MIESAPHTHGWHGAQRGNDIEMVLTGPQFAGRAWNPIRRQQFEIGEFDQMWLVDMPELAKGEIDGINLQNW